ncbi:hypothetical protein AALP_AA5G005100 [Arabis alpina]|uniref:DUF7054 domain-containing protein n=1 Tax=Arabis alpina TaxID=50452 RepID=A0A087GU22_ARAAL|nr:hypothetical protein AALP_AA5G005100 [Arabis alpina]
MLLLHKKQKKTTHKKSKTENRFLVTTHKKSKTENRFLVTTHKKSKTENRFLVSITFLGSAGPIRFLVKEDETVSNVIDYALKSYAREGRLPLLGSDSSFFLLYCPYSAPEAFNPWGKIGSTGSRNFVLSKKSEADQNIGGSSVETTTIKKISAKWKAWLNKSLGLIVPSH